MADPERLYAIGSIGQHYYDIEVRDGDLNPVGQAPFRPNIVHRYQHTVESIAADIDMLSGGSKVVSAVSIAISAAVDEAGMILQAGALHEWADKHHPLGRDLADALGMPQELVGIQNDVVAAASGERHIKTEEGREASGIVLWWGDGLGYAGYSPDQPATGYELGHDWLRDGAACNCGGRGHAEAYVTTPWLISEYRSGLNGDHRMPNRGTRAPTQREVAARILGVRGTARERLTRDLSRITLKGITRHRWNFGYELPQEVQWTGYMAEDHPIILRQVARTVRQKLGPKAPAFTPLTAGKGAVMYGAFVDALTRAGEHTPKVS